MRAICPPSALPKRTTIGASTSTPRGNGRTRKPTIRLPLSPAAAWSLCNRAVNRINDADWQAALIDLNESIRILPDYALSYANRSRVWRAKGDLEKALDDANQAISHDAKSSFSHQQLGLIFSDKQDWKSAAAEFSKAIDLGYSRSSAYHNRALAESMLGNHDAAIDDYTTAIRLTPSASSLEARGREYESRKQFDLAKADYTEAIRIDPKYQKAYFSRAALLENHFDQDDDALADYTELLSLDGKYQDARIERANIYVNTNRFALALADLDEALAGKADTPSKLARAHALRALAYIEKGNNDAAKQDADAAVERDPLSAIAYQARGRAVVARQQAELEQCPRQRSPTKMYAGEQMSPVCQSGPQYDGAIRDFDEAIRLSPQAAINYYWRTSAYEDLEKLDQALADYSAAIRLIPRAPPAISAAAGSTTGSDSSMPQSSIIRRPSSSTADLLRPTSTAVFPMRRSATA